MKANTYYAPITYDEALERIIQTRRQINQKVGADRFHYLINGLDVTIEKRMDKKIDVHFKESDSQEIREGQIRTIEKDLQTSLQPGLSRKTIINITLPLKKFRRY